MSGETVTKEGNRLQFTLPAELEQLSTLGEEIRELLRRVENLSEPEVTLYNIELAVQEIAVNIVTHAYADRPGTIGFSAFLSPNPLKLTVTMEDTGVSFDPDAVPQPHLGELQEHGFGLFLVRHLMDEVEYQKSAQKNMWRLVKFLPIDQR